MPVFLYLLFLLPLSVLAKDNIKILAETTKLQEQTLLRNYSILPSPNLEKYCLQLTQVMQFQRINQCHIIKTEHINAYVLANGHVYFSLGMMKQIKNQHQWAAILAHENAHLELNHYLKMLEKYQNPGVFFPKSKIKKMHKLHEKQADDWSHKKLTQYGFDPNQIYYFMQRVNQKNGNKKTYSHIKPSKRIKKNNGVEAIDEKLIQMISNLQ